MVLTVLSQFNHDPTTHAARESYFTSYMTAALLWDREFVMAGIIFVRTGWPLEKPTMTISVEDEGRHS